MPAHGQRGHDDRAGALVAGINQRVVAAHWRYHQVAVAAVVPATRPMTAAARSGW